ncbi:MAG: rare lipoprotein [Solirubrobacteraceae bacterium]|jgi:hypothetical protein|nr:rare lipoprotein [Solirubrobacteraceae bacterium]
MRRRHSLRAVGALLTIGIFVAAPFAARGQSQPAIEVADSSIHYGQTASVRGTVGPENAGRQVALEFSSRRDAWRVIRTATADSTGAYRFRTRLRRTGHLRVALTDATTPRAAQPASGGSGLPTTESAAPDAPRSAARRITVAARIVAPYRRLDVRSGEAAVVRGTVGPAQAGRLVRLELRDGGRWRAVDSDRTDSRGRYALSHRLRFSGGRYARVTFRGDTANARSVRRVGQVHAYREALASRYDAYGGALGCGGRLGYDSLVVAHKTLPCGTKVRIRYHGRTVVATVRDRGPYAGGREFDLAGAVARRLGFDGVGRIWVSR